MALCHRQCKECHNKVTVRIDVNEAVSISNITGQKLKDATTIFNLIVNELGEIGDVSVILRVAGVDIAERCLRPFNQLIEEECEFF